MGNNFNNAAFIFTSEQFGISFPIRSGRNKLPSNSCTQFNCCTFDAHDSRLPCAISADGALSHCAQSSTDLGGTVSVRRLTLRVVNIVTVRSGMVNTGSTGPSLDTEPSPDLVETSLQPSTPYYSRGSVQRADIGHRFRSDHESQKCLGQFLTPEDIQEW